MNKKQLQYYLKELEYLNQEGQIFAAQYPQVADKLGIHLNEFRDPHLSKLVQSVAFLTGRVAQKIDDQFNYINQNILQIISPHLIYTTPGCTILKFNIQDKNSQQIIPKGTYVTQGNNSQVRLQTSYPLNLTTTQINSINFADGYKYKLSCQNVLEMELEKIDQHTIRFYINTHYLDAMNLYRLLFDTPQQSIYLTKDDQLIYTHFKLKTVGFADDEKLYHCHEHEDNRFVYFYEFLAYYKKFMFFDLVLEDNAIALDNGKHKFVITLSDNDNPQAININKNTLLCNCTPAINMFTGHAAPITVAHEKSFEQLRSIQNNKLIHSIKHISSSIKYENNPNMVDLEYDNYLDSSPNSNTWIMFKDENRFMIGLNSEQDISNIEREVVMPVVNYYNDNIQASLHSTWDLDETISGVSCTNVELVSKPKNGIHATQYIDAIHALHTNYLGQFTYGKTRDILNRLLKLYKHLNHDHVDLDRYILDIQIHNTVTYDNIDNVLTPVPCFDYSISIDSKFGAVAYVFATIFGQTLKQNALINTAVEYHIH